MRSRSYAVAFTMSSGKRSSYELTTPAVDEERPHSFYDNLNTSSGSSGSRVIQIPDIQFKFDDDIPMGRSSALLMSNAKSDFFGLSKIPDEEPDDESDGRLLADRRTPPTIVPPAGTTATSSSSPSSTASTVPAAPPGSPEDSPRSTSRPASAQRNITIRLPEEGAPSEVCTRSLVFRPVFSWNLSRKVPRKPLSFAERHSTNDGSLVERVTRNTRPGSIGVVLNKMRQSTRRSRALQSLFDL